MIVEVHVLENENICFCSLERNFLRNERWDVTCPKGDNQEYVAPHSLQHNTFCNKLIGKG